MIKLVIFDLDGTLLDTIEDLTDATNHALRALGFPERNAEACRTMVGRGIRNLLRSALPDGAATEENVARMEQAFFPYYDVHIQDRTRPYAGIPELLEKLNGKGVRIALASNKYQEGAEKLMAHFFGRIPFVKILGQRAGQPIKPDPAIVGQILAETPEIRREEVLYVGDSGVDMQTGANAGVRTVGVTWGFRSREELAAGHPWRIAEDVEELESFIIPQ